MGQCVDDSAAEGRRCTGGTWQPLRQDVAAPREDLAALHGDLAALKEAGSCCEGSYCFRLSAVIDEEGEVRQTTGSVTISMCHTFPGRLAAKWGHFRNDCVVS